MKNKDIEEKFLDQILLDIQHVDRNRCLAIGKKTHRFHSIIFSSFFQQKIMELNY